MAYRFEIAPRALRDADEAHDWIAQASPERAALWYQGLFLAIETLQDHPQRCALAPENDYFEDEIRHLLYGRRRGVYRILFTIRGDVVLIPAVHHGARQPLRPEEIQAEDEAN